MLKQSLNNAQNQTIKSIGIVEKAIGLENGSTILIVKDITNEITFNKVINFEKTSLKQNDYVDIEYNLVENIKNGKASKSLEIALTPKTFEDTLICASIK